MDTFDFSVQTQKLLSLCLCFVILFDISVSLTDLIFHTAAHLHL